MDVGIISRRYAKALLEYAESSGCGKEVYEGMSRLSGCFLSLPQLHVALNNPVLGTEEKLSLVCQAAGGKVCEEFVRFVKLVLHAKRESCLQLMCLTYIDLYRRMKNITIGKLTTACPVEKGVEERLKALVHDHTHGDVELEMKVEPSIEGGFILDVDFNRLDASVATQFKRVHRQFMEKNRRIV